MESLKPSNDQVQDLMRQLVCVWSDFEGRLLKVPIIDRVIKGQIRLKDYQDILLNHRQQVIEGGRWIALASSSINRDYSEVRSNFIKHAATEHRDYLMLESDFVSVGGNIDKIKRQEMNIGSEALSAWMFFRAGIENPFDLLGAMFIIEGLGKSFARRFAHSIQETLSLDKDQVSFYLYHSDHDEGHLQEMQAVLESGILDIDRMSEKILKTAKVTARLYQLQWEEMGVY